MQLRHIVRHAGYRRQQPRRVGMSGCGQQIDGAAVFNQDAGIHHAYPFRHLCHHRHIVRNIDDAHPPLLADGFQFAQDARLHYHIQRGSGLIGNNQLRITGQGKSDTGALLHTS